MTISKADLVSHGFTYTHDLVLNGELAKFVAKESGISETASIYLWVSPLSGIDEFEILYIGKAGYGIKRRFGQHTGGFKNGATGKSNLKLIKEHIHSGNQIQVFARNSATISLFGAEASLYSTEEEAMCKAYEPLWNRASFPTILDSGEAMKSSGDEIESINAIYQPEVDFSQFANTEDIHAFYSSLEILGKKKFIQLLSLISKISPFSGMPQKIVGGYSGQLPGYDGIPMLVFSPTGASGKALPKQWGVRIPLVNNDDQNKSLTIIINDKYKNPTLDETLILCGDKNEFRPLDLDDFIKNYKKYIVINN
jgi:hypothetical protein